MKNDIIATHWDQLKDQVLSHWNDITEEEINKMEGTHAELLETIREKYGLSKTKAANEIESFLESGVLDNFIQKSERFINNSINGFKDRSFEVQENVVEYVKSNPVKSIALALFTGVCVAKMLKN